MQMRKFEKIGKSRGTITSMVSDQGVSRRVYLIVWKGNGALREGKTSGSPPSVGSPSASPSRCVHRRTRGTISCTMVWKSRNTRGQTTAATTVVYVRACGITYVRAMGNFMARCPRGKCGSTWDRISHKEKSSPASSLAASLRKRLTLCGGERLALRELLRELYIYIYIYIYIYNPYDSYILEKSLGFMATGAFKVLIKSTIRGDLAFLILE